MVDVAVGGGGGGWKGPWPHQHIGFYLRFNKYMINGDLPLTLEKVSSGVVGGVNGCV